jgi:hypothetical protein
LLRYDRYLDCRAVRLSAASAGLAPVKRTN